MVEQPFELEDLVILEMANSHQGSVEHGVRIVGALAEVVARHPVRAAVKLQLRDLDTFLHKDHRAGSDAKHVGRFLSTRLDRAGFQAIVQEIRARSLGAICTPFDEPSVAAIVDMGFDAIKVGSCSARDWPLLEAVAATGMPVICSTGGCTLDDIDKLVSFFEHKSVRFALMHCVAIYPTPAEHMNLAQISLLRERYPGVPIGWSTHEDPDDTEPVQIAMAKGARLFERHVGLRAEGIELNAYSSSPEQIDRWLAALGRARALCGARERPPPPPSELESLRSLERGVFALEPLEAGQALERRHVYFAFPRSTEQLQSGAFREGARLEAAVPADGALLVEQVRSPPTPDEAILKTAVHRVKGLLHQARVELNSAFTVEYSHHYGLQRFFETGAVLIECIAGREYCKKVIVQLPGQQHPAHYHRKKEETFQVLDGELDVEVDGHKYKLRPGQTVLILPGVFHSFGTVGGVVFEEVSTREFPDDSFYKDPRINAMRRSERKTVVDHWGRFCLQGPVQP